MKVGDTTGRGNSPRTSRQLQLRTDFGSVGRTVRRTVPRGSSSRSPHLGGQMNSRRDSTGSDYPSCHLSVARPIRERLRLRLVSAASFAVSAWRPVGGRFGGRHVSRPQVSGPESRFAVVLGSYRSFSIALAASRRDLSRGCVPRVSNASEGTLKGNKAHGRIGHRFAGNGGTMLRTRRWRNALKPTCREGSALGDKLVELATA